MDGGWRWLMSHSSLVSSQSKMLIPLAFRVACRIDGAYGRVSVRVMRSLMACNGV